MAKKNAQPNGAGFIEVQHKALDVVEHKEEKKTTKKADKKAVAEVVVEPAPVQEVIAATEPAPSQEEVSSEEQSSEPTA